MNVLPSSIFPCIISLDAGYRYVDFGDFSETEEDETNTLDVNASEFYFGARYSF